MNIAELKSKIILNELPSILIFTGDETGLMDIYIKEIVSKTGFKKQLSETVADVFNNCSNKSILTKNKIFIVYDDNDFLKNEKAWDKLNDILGKNKIILKYHSYDSRLSFWKFFNKNVVVFERMSESVLSKHLSSDYNLSLDRASKLVTGCGRDYFRCLLEMNKVLNLSSAKQINIDKSFDICYDKNILCLDIYTDLLNLVNFALCKNRSDLIKTYENLKIKNEPILKIIGALYYGFKNVLIAQSINNARNVQQNTGISYYNYIKAKESAGHYSNIEIENILYKLMTVEHDIKSGKIDPEIVMDFLFLTVL